MYVDVLLPLTLPRLLTYKVPEEWSLKISVGVRVTVQLRDKKLYSAIVADIHGNTPADFATKEIINIIDREPIVNHLQLKFWNWIAEYYLCSMGEVMKAALPSGLKMESETMIKASQIGTTEDATSKSALSDIEQKILNEIGEKSFNIKELCQRFNHNNILPILHGLFDQKLLSIDEELKNNYRLKLKSFISLHPGIRSTHRLNAILNDLERAPKQRKLVKTYLTVAAPISFDNPLEIAKNELLAQAESTASILKSCIEKDIFIKIDKQVERNINNSVVSQSLPILSEAQERAFDHVRESFTKQQAVLLHGITSSGKTEVYIRLIDEQLQKNKQVLYLLPEIALTTQIIERLQLVFGNKVGVYHSRFSDAERVETYNRLLGLRNADDKAYIILGVRSSVFLPFSNLGLIIVDEEHESSYKQYDPAPRYNARDVSIVLASMHGAKTLLGSATPSLESYNNARNNKYGLVELLERYGNAQLPKIEVVDMVKARKKKLVHSHFSTLLLDAISDTLLRGEQVILFQNRRGFSAFVQCQSCGYVPHCRYCDVSLTQHKHNQQLSCHYCGFSIPVLTNCEQCASPEISACGFGTEKIEEELSILLPQARIERLDLDTTRTKNAYEKIFRNFETQASNILVGTQMIAKGLDFANVSLVGILNADNMLNFPDFRAYERSFQLMSQVAGRAGRKNTNGRVIIQTSTPNNSVINQVIQNDYKGLYFNQIEERKQFFYPPYSRLLVLTIKHTKQNIVYQAATQLKGMLGVIFAKNVTGPEAPAVARIQNKYLLVFRLKLERNDRITHYKTLLVECLQTLVSSSKNYASLQVSIDVDPA